MNLHDIGDEQLYFEEQVPEEVAELLEKASVSAEEGGSEQHLLRAFFHSPKNLMVLVGLYRYYFYQHRFEEAIKVSQSLIQVCAERLRLPSEWEYLRLGDLSQGVLRSMGMLRLYLMALKAQGFLYLRLGKIDEGRARLAKVREMDEKDRLGAGALLEIVDAHCPKPMASNTEECIA